MADNKVVYEMSVQDMLTPKIKDAETSVVSLEGAMSSLKSAALGAFAGWGLKELIGDIVESGSMVENAKIGLTTMLGDAAEAQAVITQTMKDAAATPFEFKGLLDANKLLISAQVESTKAREDVLNLANAVAATGGGNDELNRMVANLAQIRNVGQASAMDIKQFAMANINIYKIMADSLGITTAQLKKKLDDGLVITYDQITNALKKAHEAGGIYAGGLEAMAGATSVKISNLGDSLFQLSVTIFNDLKPTIDQVIQALSNGIRVLANAWEWVKLNRDTIKEYGEYLGIVVGAIAAYNAVTFIAAKWTAISAGATAFWATTQQISAIATAVLSGEVSMLTVAQTLLNEAMSANPIGFIITALAILAIGVTYAYNHFATFRAVLWGTWEFLKAFFNWMVVVPIKVLESFGEMLVGALSFDTDMIAAGFERAKSVVFDGAVNLATSFKKGYDEGMADWSKEQTEKAASINPAATNAAVAAKKTGPIQPVSTQTTTAGKVTGPKVTHINIKIENLVKEFRVMTTNITESPAKIKEMITRAVVEAVNDSELLVGE